MTWDTSIRIGHVSFTVRELMKQVVSANTLTEAHDKAYWILKALQEDYDQEIADKLDEVLNEFHNEPEFAIIERGIIDGINPPTFLTNNIFVTELKVSLWEESFVYIDMENLWFWIYSNLVRNLKARYEWGALFLFAKWKGLIPESINVKKFCEQMNIWFGKEYTNYLCSYSQVTCYLAGFFQRKDFNFRTWINEDKFIIPSSYKLRKDQKEDGFKRIHELCCSLEANYSFDLIQVKDRNR